MREENRHYCKNCCSLGFKPSILPNRCTFCDGTEGGSPPTEQELAEALLPQGYTMVPSGTPRAKNYKYWADGTWKEGCPGGVGLKSTTWKIANPIQEQKTSDAPDYTALDERNEALAHIPEGYALEPRGGSRREGYLYWSTASQMWEPGCGDEAMPIPAGMLVANKLPPNYPPEREMEEITIKIPKEQADKLLAELRNGKSKLSVGYEIPRGVNLTFDAETQEEGPGDDFELPPGYVRVPTGGRKVGRWLFKQGGWWRYGSKLQNGGIVTDEEVVAEPEFGYSGVSGPSNGKAYEIKTVAAPPKSGEPRYWVSKGGELIEGTLVEMVSQEVWREVMCGYRKLLVPESQLVAVELDEHRQKEFEKAVEEIKNLKLPEDARQILYTALLNIVRIGR